MFVCESGNGFDSVRVVFFFWVENPCAQLEFIAGLRLNSFVRRRTFVALRLCAPLPPGWSAGNGLATGKLGD